MRVQRAVRSMTEINFVGPVGTVFEVGMAEDGERLAYVCVRWDNGKLEKLSDEDAWELEDVTPCLFVNVYMWDRVYGGPEEGGWFYNVYDPEDDECAVYESEEEAMAAYDAKVEWAKEENGTRRHPSSVCSEGHFVVRLESWPAEHSPASRPHYS